MFDMGVSLDGGDPRFEAASVRGGEEFECTFFKLTVGFRIWENQSLVERPIPSF